MTDDVGCVTGNVRCVTAGDGSMTRASFDKESPKLAPILKLNLLAHVNMYVACRKYVVSARNYLLFYVTVCCVCNLSAFCVGSFCPVAR